MKKILFCTPSMGLSGSEVALYNIINHLSNSDFTIAILAYEHGSLLDNITSRKFIYLDFVQKWRPLYMRFLWKLLFYKAEPKKVFFNKIVKKTKPDIIFFNTLITTDLVYYSGNFKTILYLHDMDWTFSYFTGEQLELVKNKISQIICCSAASELGVKQLGRENGSKVIYPGIEFDQIKITKKPEQVRELLNIKQSSFIWAMSGTLDRNKNPKVFVEIANILINNYNKDVIFIWIGGNLKSGEGFYVKQLCKYYNINDKVIFLGNQTSEYYNYLNCCDGFVLTSTYDSFPLVLLEAAFLEKPIVGFDSGGIKEFVKEGMGFVSENRSNEGIIKHMLSIMNNPSIINSSLLKKTSLRYSAENTANQIKKFIINL